MGHAAVPKRVPRSRDVPSCTQAMGAQMGSSGLTPLHSFPPPPPSPVVGTPFPCIAPIPRPLTSSLGRGRRDGAALPGMNGAALRAASAGAGAKRSAGRQREAGTAAASSRGELGAHPEPPSSLSPPPKPGGGTIASITELGAAPLQPVLGTAEAVLRLHESIPSLAVALMQMGTTQLLAFSLSLSFFPSPAALCSGVWRTNKHHSTIRALKRSLYTPRSVYPRRGEV